MRIVVADTGPLNYLVLIGQVHLLPALFEKVIVPTVVYQELTSPRAPLPVRLWLNSNPLWLELHNETLEAEPLILTLDAGEAQAIQLAILLQADLLLIDDRKGVKLAQAKGLRVTGTLGLLDLAADRNLVDFEEAIQQLELTNFRRPLDVLDLLLTKHKKSQTK
ncbi:MAG: DUF3368 domain-containing protein [Acidobacteria bacterium]|nr:DUF3368 domain-containing protein [Acidobacteriota bacterium]